MVKLDLAPFLASLEDAYRAGTLPPATFRDVAERAGCSVATVSRFVQGYSFPGPSGEAVPGRALFTSSLQSEDGEASSHVTRGIIASMVAASHPIRLSDQAVSDRLWSLHGIRCARRTVAKYRAGSPVT